MAQYDDAPSYSFDLPVDRGPSLLSGTPAVLTSAFDFLSTLPSVFAQAANEVLEEHVSESRERLERDDDYQSIAKYYDVVQVEDGEGEGVELDFGFFKVPPNLSHKPLELEVGDAINPPKAFVRRTIFQILDDVVEEIGRKVNQHYA